MKKVLILSCNTGQGHNSCAQAIQEYFEGRGVLCDIQDSLTFTSPGFSQFISWGHSTVYRYFPGLFQWGYRMGEKHPAMFAEASLSYRLLAKGAEALYHCIRAENYDTVICTHIFSAITLTEMMRKMPLPIQTALLATDYTCSPGVDATNMQWYFTPDASLTEAFTAAGIPAEKIVPSGIPVRPAFDKSVELADAKRLLNLPLEHKHLLVSCGSMGCGHMRTILHYVVQAMPPDLDVTVVCGTNARLVRKMSRKYRKNKNVHIVGYTGEMPLYMDAADLYLTKPGGISVTEAAVKGLPMVLINAVSGCEDHNRRFVARHVAVYSGRSSKKLAEQCLRLLYTEEELRNMRNALQSSIKSDMGQIWAALGGTDQEQTETGEV